MSVSATVTPGAVVGSDDQVTVSLLNLIANPTVDVEGAFSGISIEDGAVTNAKIATNTGISLSKLATGVTEQVMVCDASGFPVYKLLGGDVTNDNLGVVTIANDAITTAKILDANVTTDKIADDAVDASKLAENAGALWAPPGAITQYAGIEESTPPTGWQFCHGATLNRTTYAALFAVLSTRYNTGGEAETVFRLPNFKSRVPMGWDDGDTDYEDMGLTGGSKTHTLTESEMPAHTHVTTLPIYSGSGASPTLSTHSGTWGSTPFSVTTSSTGSGGEHTNIQPFLVVNYIIKT